MNLHRYYLLAAYCDPPPPFCWGVEPPTTGLDSLQMQEAP